MTRTNAIPQTWARWLGHSDLAFSKIANGMAETGSKGCHELVNPPPITRSTGAVSPTAREIARMQPVTMPVIEEGRTTFNETL